MRLLTTFLVILAAALMWTSVLADDAVSGLIKKVDSGKNVVVLFVSNEEMKKTANTVAGGLSEFYSDWHFYLGSFLKNQGPKAVVYKMSVADGRRFFHSANLPKDEWSIVFIKKGRPALYSADPIMEQVVYQFASDYFSGIDSPHDAHQLGFSYIALH